MDVSDWSARGTNLVGSLLLFRNIEDCSVKKELKNSAFWRKSVKKLPSWYSGGMIDIFHHSQKFLKMDQ